MDLPTYVASVVATAAAAVKLRFAANCERTTPSQDQTGRPTGRISNIAARVVGAGIEVDYGMSRAACSEYDLSVGARFSAAE